MPRDRGDVVAVLTRKGFDPDFKRGRDHDWYFFRHPRLIRSIGTYVSRGSDHEISDYLLGKMSRQLQLTRGEFDLLLDCDWEKSDFITTLQARGLLREVKPHA